MPLSRLLFILALIPNLCWAWGEPHVAITKAALDTLPAWQKELLGPELKPLADYYCTIPDNVHSDKENVKFAMMDTQPGVIYILKLHLPEPGQPENLETLRYFMTKAVDSLKAGQTPDAARYMGSICHLIEDFGSPSHTIPGDNMFTLLQQFMPPPDHMKGKLLHGPIENGTFSVSIEGYQPRLLGETVEEAAWRLLHRVHEGIINARSTTIPIIQALYAQDPATVTTHQLRAATVDARIVADAIYTMLCLGAGKFEAPEQAAIQTVDIATFYPTEALNLYWPQAQFAGAPNWGPARMGEIVDSSSKPSPLKLRLPDSTVKEYPNGVSVIMGKDLTYLLPKGVYTRFTVSAGLHADLGAKGRVEFTIRGDGKPLASAVVNGDAPAHGFEVDITGVEKLQLAAQNRGIDAKSAYAVWAAPVLGR